MKFSYRALHFLFILLCLTFFASVWLTFTMMIMLIFRRFGIV